MPRLLDRRIVAGALIGGPLAVPALARQQTGRASHPVDPDPSPGLARARTEIEALETKAGGRLGALAIDSGTGATIGYRADERFPMCSTHKMLSGAAILARIDAGTLALDRRVPFGRADLLEYAPAAKQHVEAGFMTVEELCRAAIRLSDNTAANLLIDLIGGPAGWTRYARSIGDSVSRLDRMEPDLNTAVPGDPRDTTTPAAMSASLAAVLFGTALTDPSRSRLKSWMLDSDITASLFRAGLPSGWHVADKSGSGENGSRNDVGILYPPASAPILLSVFLTGSSLPPAERDAIVARSAAIVAGALRSPAR